MYYNITHDVLYYADVQEELVESEFSHHPPILDPSKCVLCRIPVKTVLLKTPPLVTTQCESSSDVPAASKDVCHTLETTTVSYSTQTTAVPSSTAVSKSERETLQVPHSENATEIRDGKNCCFKTYSNLFSPIAPMKESTTEQDEGETGTAGYEANSTQNTEATGKIISVTFHSI